MAATTFTALRAHPPTDSWANRESDAALHSLEPIQYPPQPPQALVQIRPVNMCDEQSWRYESNPGFGLKSSLSLI